MLGVLGGAQRATVGCFGRKVVIPECSGEGTVIEKTSAVSSAQSERWWLCVFKCQEELEVIVLGNAVLTREQQLKQLPRFDSCKFFACSLLFMLGRQECKYGL